MDCEKGNCDQWMTKLALQYHQMGALENAEKWMIHRETVGMAVPHS